MSFVLENPDNNKQFPESLVCSALTSDTSSVALYKRIDNFAEIQAHKASETQTDKAPSPRYVFIIRKHIQTGKHRYEATDLFTIENDIGKARSMFDLLVKTSGAKGEAL